MFITHALPWIMARCLHLEMKVSPDSFSEADREVLETEGRIKIIDNNTDGM